MAQPDATVLRQRAARLRRSAAAIDDSEWWILRRRAGTDTWEGPTARAFLDELIAAEFELAAAYDGLLISAAQLERAALAAEAAALAETVRAAAAAAAPAAGAPA